MRRIEIAALLVFALSLVLKLVQIPYATLGMVGGIGLLVLAVMLLTFSRSQKEHETWTLFALGAWMGTLLVLTKFLPAATIFLVGSLTYTGLAFWLARGQAVRSRWMSIGLLAILSLILFLMPVHQRYHLLHFTFHPKLGEDYRTWDKYSWFLYQADKYDEAKEASDRALSIAEKEGDESWARFIQMHNEKIDSHVWDVYTEEE
ncbi:MAG TPA: hypothetical protein DCE41_28225 [Cytophagales bacterium]|nr:hypothetical protein [Cytophagales bacterium]HAA18849.1 hypothetical protein [Cytophagales bacterium]HAP59838.1 hypothetical protein [Cytophagales bacterium]